MSVPVIAAGVFLGVAGGDVVMSQLEPRLIAILRTAPQEAVVVNRERRVLAANTATWVVGTRLQAMPVVGEGGFVDAAEVPDGPGWVVAVGDRLVGL